MRRMWSVAVVAAVAVVGCKTRGGEGSGVLQVGGGNGLDYHARDDRAAWFVGADRELVACVALSPAFRQAGVDEAKAAQVVKTTYEQWLHYIDAKRVFAKASPAQKFPTKLTVKTQCPADVADTSVDLRFLFGTREGAVGLDEIVAVSLVGYARRYPDEREGAWRRGFVWVREPHKRWLDQVQVEMDYRDDYSLASIVLHEWGHVLGNLHVDGTIMDEGYVQRVVEQKAMEVEAAGDAEKLAKLKERGAFLTRIDDTRDLAVCETCEVECIPGLLGATPQDAAQNYKILSGEDAPAGAPILAILGRVDGGNTLLEIGPRPRLRHMLAVYSDARQVGAFTLQRINAVDTPIEIFTRIGAPTLRHRTLTYTGKLHEVTGNAPEYDIRLERNNFSSAAGGSSALLMYLTPPEGEERLIFVKPSSADEVFRNLPEAVPEWRKYDCRPL